MELHKEMMKSTDAINITGRGAKLSVTYSTATTPVLASGVARRYKTDFVRRYGAARGVRGDSVEMVMHPYGYFDGEGRVRYYLHDFQGNVTMVVDNEGEVLQHTRYYPYGEAIDVFAASVLANTATTADRAQPYLYGCKELERMHGLGEYELPRFFCADARRLQSHLSLWTTQDPCLEKYFATSPYAYCAANPIRFTDPTGCQFTWYSVQYVERFLQEVQRRKDQAQSNKQQLLSQLCGGNLSVEQMSDIAQQINNETAKIEEFKAIVEEIDILTNSSQVYNINIDSNFKPNGQDGFGLTCMNYSTKNLEITLQAYDFSLLGHELKHAFQFEIGEYCSAHISTGPEKLSTFIYGIEDEYVAYYRQAMLGGSVFTKEDINTAYSYLKPIARNISEFISKNNIPLDKLDSTLQRLANQWYVSFRWNSKTYISQKLMI